MKYFCTHVANADSYMSCEGRCGMSLSKVSAWLCSIASFHPEVYPRYPYLSSHD